jgi:predicted nucleic acid-binding protein
MASMIAVSILVDTPIWSLAFRRPSSRLSAIESALARELERLIRVHRALLLGVVRQEVLSGIRDELRFQRLLQTLRGFPDVTVELEDYERAASSSNRCRRYGVQGSSADYLICAVAIRLDVPIFTTDADFVSYARYLPIELHAVPQASDV